MAEILLGHTGFVGGVLTRQHSFDEMFNSATIAQAAGRKWDLVVCAAAPGRKWLANRDPIGDLKNIKSLIEVLEKIRCKHFVLVSTIDVFQDNIGADENTPAPLDNLEPYGKNRRKLELFVAEYFQRSTTIRLPAVVGPGLRKNVLYDLHHNHQTHKIDRRGLFQFYPMVNLWTDICRALELGLPLLHLATEPISVADVVQEAFNRHQHRFPDSFDQPPAKYDFRSVYDSAFNGSNGYLYSRREVLLAVRAYAQSEPVRPVTLCS